MDNGRDNKAAENAPIGAVSVGAGGFAGGNIGIGGGTFGAAGTTGTANGERKRGRPASSGSDGRDSSAGTGPANATGTAGSADANGNIGQGDASAGPESVDFGDAKTRRTRTKKSDLGVLKPSDLAPLVQGLVFVIGQTRPPYLRAAYDIPESLCVPIAEPLSRILAKLPEKYTDAILNAIDPIALVIASYGVYSVISDREKFLHVKYTEFLEAQRANQSVSEPAAAPTAEPTVGAEADNFVSHPEFP